RDVARATFVQARSPRQSVHPECQTAKTILARGWKNRRGALPPRCLRLSEGETQFVVELQTPAQSTRQRSFPWQSTWTFRCGCPRSTRIQSPRQFQAHLRQESSEKRATRK